MTRSGWDWGARAPLCPPVATPLHVSNNCQRLLRDAADEYTVVVFSNSVYKQQSRITLQFSVEKNFRGRACTQILPLRVAMQSALCNGLEYVNLR